MIKVVQKNEDLFIADGELSGEESIYILLNGNKIILRGYGNKKTYIFEMLGLSKQAVDKALASIFNNKTFISFNAKQTMKTLLNSISISPTMWRCCYVNAQVLKKGINLQSEPEFIWHITQPLGYSECETEILKLVEIFDSQAARLKAESLDSVSVVESGAIPAFAQMETYGAPVDVSLLGEMHREWFAKTQWDAEEVQKELPGEKINLESSKELLEKFQSMKIKIKTPDGKKVLIPDTSKDTLSQMISHSDLRDTLIAYRSSIDTFEKIVSLRKFVKDKRIYATFNQLMAATGRTSTQDPNLAGLPKGMRKIFMAPRGQKIITGDYKQCELKIIAHISQDKRMIAAFKNNEDIHMTTAKEVWGDSAITDEVRKKAKAVNFGLAYGQTEEGLAVKLGCDIKEARDIMEAHAAKFPDVYKCLRQLGDAALKSKRAKSILGRVRILDDKATDGAIRRAGANMAIQGTAADILKLALWHLMRKGYQQKLPFYVWNSVYDEISLLSADRHQNVSNALMSCMNFAMETVIPSVPPGVDISITDRWE